MSKKNLNNVIWINYILLASIVGCVGKPLSAQKTVTPTILPVTLIPTQTFPVATLSSQSAKELLNLVLVDNGGCSLPCIWGISPGKTELSELKNFLTGFGNNEIPNNYYSKTSFYESLGGVGIGVWDGNIRTSYRFDYRGDNNNIEYLNLSAEAYREKGEGIDRSAIVEIGDPQFNQALSYYTLQSILASYGPPSQIILAPYPDTPEQSTLWVPFSLVLFYEQQGILVEYVAPKNTIEDDFEFCPSQMAHISVFTWQSDKNLSLNEVVNSYSGYKLSSATIDYFKSIENATNLTITDFTNLFKDPERQDCLRTPVNLWPKP